MRERKARLRVVNVLAKVTQLLSRRAYLSRQIYLHAKFSQTYTLYINYYCPIFSPYLGPTRPH